MSSTPSEVSEEKKEKTPSPQSFDRLLSIAGWAGAAAMLGVMVFLILQVTGVVASAPLEDETLPTLQPTSAPVKLQANVSLPSLKLPGGLQGVDRLASPHTIIPTHPREEVVEYQVEKGDSVFSISRKYNLKPETILWSNYDKLNDNPDAISAGIKLTIPATDGVYYKWKEGDTIESVAGYLKVKAQDILTWPANKLDLFSPALKAGQYVMVPGGKREFKQWVIPTIPRGKSSVLKSVLGDGACDTPESGAGGSGSFVWPAANHFLSGNDYWSGHLGVDVAAGEGAPIFAADTGMVVFSGWANGGYGYTVVIDHGNGYQTLYAHLSAVGTHCGQNVSKGGTIAGAGNTGNSFGAHLHFEVRYQGGFVSPWSVLP